MVVPLQLPGLGPLAVELLLSAFAGGLLGAALGAYGAFALAGLVVVAGEAATLVGRSVGAETAAVDPSLPLAAAGLTGSVGLGPVLGPHVAFAGGAAAAAFAARRGDVPADTEYHPAKAVGVSLGADPAVLVAGGVFGAFGYAVAAVSGSLLALPLDPVALAVVVSGFTHRLVFGYPLVGRPEGGWLDMSAYDGERTREGGERPVVEPFLPHQSGWARALVLGVGTGLFGAYVAYRTASPYLAFGLASVTLALVVVDNYRPPVVLHMALPASLAALSLVPAQYGLGEMTPALVASEVPFLAALLLGAGFGALAGLAGEFFGRTLYAHADTHLDPPMAAVAATTLVLGVLVLAGVLPNGVVLPMP